MKLFLLIFGGLLMTVCLIISGVKSEYENELIEIFKINFPVTTIHGDKETNVRYPLENGRDSKSNNPEGSDHSQEMTPPGISKIIWEKTNINSMPLKRFKLDNSKFDNEIIRPSKIPYLANELSSTTIQDQTVLNFDHINQFGTISLEKKNSDTNDNDYYVDGDNNNDADDDNNNDNYAHGNDYYKSVLHQPADEIVYINLDNDPLPSYFGQQYENKAVDMLAGYSSNDNNNWAELKLLGSTEQCGPGRKRDRYGICRLE